jgi:hypothetical protein
MEMLFALVAFLAVDIVALEFGFSRRESHALSHHDRAIDAVRRGELDVYRLELAQMEREIANGTWRPF